MPYSVDKQNSGGSIRKGLDEHFLLEMAEFLGAFMEANLGRVLGMGERDPFLFLLVELFLVCFDAIFRFVFYCAWFNCFCVVKFVCLILALMLDFQYFLFC